MPSKALALASVASLSILLAGSIVSPGAPGPEPVLAPPHADPIPYGVPTLDDLKLQIPGLTTTAAAESIVCATPGQGRHQLVFAYPAGVMDRSAALGPLMLEHFAVAAGIVTAEGLLHQQSVRYRVACSGEVPVVSVVALPTPAWADSWESLKADLTNAGYSDGNTKYVVWYDDPMPCGCSGMGTLWLDDRRTPANYNNRGHMFGATFIQNDPIVLAAAYYVMLHESGHTMGAVQASAPHFDGTYHCRDGLDILCYDLGNNGYRADACPPTAPLSSSGQVWNYLSRAGRFDCNGDDYFNPNPQHPNYLCYHWNLGHPDNRFLQFDLPQAPAAGPLGSDC